MSELKPCPFCGGLAHTAHHISRTALTTDAPGGAFESLRLLIQSNGLGLRVEKRSFKGLNSPS